MSEEFAPSMESVDAGAGESSEGPSQLEIARVEAQAQKAKQMGGIATQNRSQNNMIAQFLTVLLQKIDNDELLLKFHHTFFRSTDKYGNNRIRKNINKMIMVGLFVPFYQNEIDKFGLTNFFSSLYQYGTTPTMHNYIPYLQNLFFHHFKKVPLEKDKIIGLILGIMEYFGLTSKEQMTEQFTKETASELHTRLFSHQVPPATAHTQVRIPNNPHHHGKHGHHQSKYPSPKNHG